MIEKDEIEKLRLEVHAFCRDHGDSAVQKVGPSWMTDGVYRDSSPRKAREALAGNFRYAADALEDLVKALREKAVDFDRRAARCKE